MKKEKQPRYRFPVKIYAIKCPLENRVVYVGKTIRSLNTRLSEHITSPKSEIKIEWAKKLRQAGMKPEIFLLEELPAGSSWEKSENKWIKFYDLDVLLNGNGGGAGGDRTGNIVSLRRFDELLSKRFSGNTRKNYLSEVKKFLKAYTEYNKPIEISCQKISRYLSTIENKNSFNSALCALKLFYKEVIRQPGKLDNIKFK